MAGLHCGRQVTNTFINKVVAERQVLDIVNRAFFGKLQLTGLSSSAIESWRSKVALSENHPLIKSLVALGMLTQTLSNRSNESFTPLDPNVEPEIERILGDLPRALALARAEH